jgi:hypothetical protein
MRRHSPHLAIALACAALASGCAPDDASPPAVVAQSADAMEVSTQESALLMAVGRAIEAPRSSADRVGDAIARATQQTADLFGAGCNRTVTREGANGLSVRLRECNGGLGLRSITGELHYGFEFTADGSLRITVRLNAGEALRVGGARITELDSSALVRLAPGLFSLTIERSAYTAVGARGQYLQREVSPPGDPSPLRATWTPAGACFGLSGAWRVRVGPSAARTRSLRVAVSRYRRCGGACPALADDAVVVTDESPDGGVNTFTLSFLGASTATWTTTSPPASGTVPLNCMN